MWLIGPSGDARPFAGRMGVGDHGHADPGSVERAGYDLDVDRLFELAAETGTVLEVDGAPSHLDLEASLARRAVRAGVMLSIDSDAHRTEMLERHMALGLLIARRGWVQPQNVLNTRALSELKQLLAAKRAHS